MIGMFTDLATCGSNPLSGQEQEEVALTEQNAFYIFQEKQLL